MSSPKVHTGDVAPFLSVPIIDGGEPFVLTETKPEKFTIVVFYRGTHCPICVAQLQELEESYKDAQKQGVDVIAISMDTEERTRQTIDKVLNNMKKKKEEEEGGEKEEGESLTSLQLPIGYNLSEEIARSWGLFISEAIEGYPEPPIFSEPGMFVILPDKIVYSSIIQTNPFTRPNFKDVLGGLQYIVEHNYPFRGTLTKK
eukprot:CAMPEP_0116550794 /NCGR_PEP_ID=MMETSP0397-20121206/5618_1 /TAXON_ID=216820 /ORGANISM="Cyclophora tenuis, Strain ECT3854" /LENGTH=200 /DNA_ID=CAMNT_0004075651 /DNA_START=32 /DNA_END=634 /DNA_ORIENTATION=-